MFNLYEKIGNYFWDKPIVYSPVCLRNPRIVRLRITKLTKQLEYLKDAIDAFVNDNSDISSMDAAGEKVMVALYGSKENDSLKELRYSRLIGLITKSKFNLASLPPTKIAALQHSLQSPYWIDNKK